MGEHELAPAVVRVQRCSITAPRAKESYSSSSEKKGLSAAGKVEVQALAGQERAE